MKTTVSLISLFALAAILTSGCGEKEIYQADPALHEVAQQEGFFVTSPREVDLVEKLAASRAQYFADVEALKDFYSTTGNQQKYYWSSKEMEAFEKAPKYKYLMPAETAGVKLTASESIPAADELFEEAMDLYRQSIIIPIIPDKGKMRKAITKLNAIISDYPTSDKVDDAAYRAGELYEKFDDFSLAANYYQKAYLWDDMTPYPARYKAAKILDYKLKRRDEALAVYKLSVEKEARYSYYANRSQERIDQLTVPEMGAVDMKDGTPKPVETEEE